jgi:hypothetical protein
MLGISFIYDQVQAKKTIQKFPPFRICESARSGLLIIRGKNSMKVVFMPVYYPRQFDWLIRHHFFSFSEKLSL